MNTLNERVNGRTDGRTDGRMDGTNERTNEQIEMGWREGEMEGGRKGWVNEKMDGLRNRRISYLPIIFSEPFHTFPHHSEHNFQHRVNQIFFSSFLFFYCVSTLIGYVTGAMRPAKRACD